MAHFLYRVLTTDKAPAGDGDAMSWLKYYKFNAGGECFLPAQMVPSQKWNEAMVGDYVWMAAGNEVLGGAEIIRVEVEESRRTIELWYNGDDVLELPEHVVPPAEHGKIWDKVGEEWLVQATRRCSNTEDP